MFGKNTGRILITITDEKITLSGSGHRRMNVGEIMEVIKSLASEMEKQTGIKSHIILTKCAFELI